MKRLIPILLVLSLAFSCANQTDPVTGERYYSPLGNDYASQLAYVQKSYLNQLTTVQDGGDLNDPIINEAAEKVFRRMVAAMPDTHKRDFKFDLKLSASTQVNAYTYGAGFLRCHLGLIAQCEDVSEFAGIIAHELGHNSHDHVGQTIGRTQVSQQVLGFGGVLGRPGQLVGTLIGGGAAAVALNKYSRAQENQADTRAIEYTSRGGIDPEGLANFFDRLAQMESRRGRPPQLFLSHPYSENRVAAVRQQVAELPGGVPDDIVRSTPEFARAIARAREIMPYYANLERALNSDDKPGALKAAREGIAALPTHAAFHFWAGASLYMQDKPEEAVIELRNANRLDQTNFLIPLVLATLELETNNPDRAEPAATKLIGLMPALPQGFLMRGVARYAQGKKEPAFEDFDQGLARIANSRQRRQTRDGIVKNVPEYGERK